MTAKIRIGTRGSQLAMWQANAVRRKLREAGFECEIVEVTTTGDQRQDVSLASIGGKGVFIKELEEALERRQIDIAVHSLKDVPSSLPPQFTLAAFLERADPRDAWVQRDRIPIAGMPDGATVGTSAPRRRAQLRSLFPKLRMEEMRGNVDTRIEKVRSHQYDGAVLASAGMTRLGRENEITSYFSIDEMTPAAGQGVIVVETMIDNMTAEVKKLAAALDHAPTSSAALCERDVLQKFDDRLDCYSAVGVHAEVGAETTIRAFFGEVDGDRTIRVVKRGMDPDAVVRDVFDALVAGGAMSFAVRRSPIAEAKK